MTKGKSKAEREHARLTKIAFYTNRRLLYRPRTPVTVPDLETLRARLEPPKPPRERRPRKPKRAPVSAEQVPVVDITWEDPWKVPGDIKVTAKTRFVRAKKGDWRWSTPEDDQP